MCDKIVFQATTFGVIVWCSSSEWNENLGTLFDFCVPFVFPIFKMFMIIIVFLEKNELIM